MSKIVARIYTEPVLAQGVVVAAVSLGTAFGLGWSAEQVGAVTSFTAAVLTLFTRRAVTPIGRPLPPPIPPNGG